jgi:hypothetical protein
MDAAVISADFCVLQAAAIGNAESACDELSTISMMRNAVPHHLSDTSACHAFF